MAVAKTSPESSYEPPPQLLLELALAVALEGCQRPLRKIHGAPGGVLGLGEDQPAGLAFLFMPAHPLQLAIHAQGPAGEIYVRPLEPQGLAHPEPGREGQDVKSLMAVSGLACDAKERARLLGVERLYLFLPDLGRIAARPVDRGLVRPGIAAHAHAWRVHYGKQHLRLITVVVL